MILKSLLPFLPIISDRDEVKGHVILAKTCYFWMILKICSTFYEIPSNAIKWIEMTIFSRKVFYLCRTRKRGELLLATMSIGVGCPFADFCSYLMWDIIRSGLIFDHIHYPFTAFTLCFWAWFSHDRNSSRWQVCLFRNVRKANRSPDRESTICVRNDISGWNMMGYDGIFSFSKKARI